MRVKRLKDMVKLVLMPGLAIQIAQDGTWMQFDGDRQSSVVRLESLGNESWIIRGGITNWCENMRNRMAREVPMINTPSVKEILHTADGIRDKPMPIENDAWDLASESVQAIRELVCFSDNNGNRCFCDQWKDPQGLQHSGACLNAQEVLRRADSL